VMSMVIIARAFERRLFFGIRFLGGGKAETTFLSFLIKQGDLTVTRLSPLTSGRLGKFDSCQILR